MCIAFISIELHDIQNVRLGIEFKVALVHLYCLAAQEASCPEMEPTPICVLKPFRLEGSGSNWRKLDSRTWQPWHLQFFGQVGGAQARNKKNREAKKAKRESKKFVVETGPNLVPKLNRDPLRNGL